MVEEMYVEETKEQDSLNNDNVGHSSDAGPDRPDRIEDNKPTADQLVRIDSECLSSIVTNPDKDQHHYGTTSYGAMELDFASYNQNNTVSFQDNNLNFNGGVSLTLGLQQHGNAGGGGGVSLAFSSPSTASQSSMFYPRDHHHQHQEEQDQMEPVVQYTMMDGEAQNNLPYRNLMGAQLLHDLAG